jgi:hypothetical protein
VLHLDQKLRVTPLYIEHPRTLERRPGCGEALKLTEKLGAFLTSKSDERCPSVVQSRAIVVGQKRP